MRVCLINCAVGVAGFNPNWPGQRPRGDREGSWIGHGISSVGASVKTAGHNCELIDLRQQPNIERLGQIVKWSPADVYGLSVSPVDELAALQAIIQIKTNSPKSKIVVGGILPTIFPEKFDFDAVDCIIQGEGEITFVDILRRFECGGDIPKRIRGQKPNLDSIPWVDRSLFDYRRELECYFAPGQMTPSVTMLAGRGCPFKCNYCQPAESAVFGMPYRMRSPENVVKELKALKRRYNFRSITFWDDTFTFKKSWIEEFCDRYEAERFNATIAACSRADIIVKNQSMIARMAKIGVDWLVIGLESGSQRILDLIEKGTTVQDNRDAVRICHENGIKVFGTFMLGLPTETREESEETLKMVGETGVDLPSPFFFRPIPGTGIYDFCEKNDLILPHTKEVTIARTGIFEPTIKGVDYDYILSRMPKEIGVF